MRSTSWRLLVAACLAGAPAAPSAGAQVLPSGPWRLFRLFEPVPGLQRGVDVWALESDLVRPPKKGAAAVAVTTLTLDQDEQSGELRKTSYYTSEYNCSTGQSRTLRSREIVVDRKVNDDRTPREWAPIIPHTFGARVLPFLCDGARLADLKRASDVDEALAIERNMDREFDKARVAEQEVQTPPQ